MKARADLLASFRSALEPVGVLDRFKVTGIFASWWSEVQYDLRTIVNQGFEGLVEGWVATIVDALTQEDENGKKSNKTFDPLRHPITRHLLPEYVGEITEAEARRGELEAGLEAATETPEEDDDQAEESLKLSEAQLKQLQADVRAARKRVRDLSAGFIARLHAARSKMSAQDCERLALSILRESCEAHRERYLREHLDHLVAAFESWWDKYRVELSTIQEYRRKAESETSKILEQLGYV
jgi:type I restriction enzyme M protein